MKCIVLREKARLQVHDEYIHFILMWFVLHDEGEGHYQLFCQETVL